VALPKTFPNLQALAPASSGLPLSYSGFGPVITPVYTNALGGTAAAGTTVTRFAPATAAPATTVDITISAAGTDGNTINMLAIVPGTF
jgi:hypothetical protein